MRTVGRGSFGEALLVKHRSTGQLSVLKRVRLEARRKQIVTGDQALFSSVNLK